MADNSKEWDSGLTIMEKSKKALLKEEFHEFCKKIKEYKYVCLFGIGRMAEGWGYEFVRTWGTDNIVCFSDNNPKMWGKVIVDGIKCVPPNELPRYGKDLFCVVATSEANYLQISEQLKRLGINNMALKHSWLGIDEIIEEHLGIKLPETWKKSNKLGAYDRESDSNSKIAVYTCIVGGYDDLRQPIVCDSRCDYYFLGFEKPENAGVYRWIDIADKLPDGLDIKDLTRINRYCKMHPHIFFPQYEYSIYVDGMIEIKTEIAHLIQKIGNIGIASYGMPTAEDIYEHASNLCHRNGKGEGKERIRKQMQRYAKEGFPRYFGITENGVMVREHHNKDCIRVMETWWDEVLNNSRRDQLSFMYAVWKNGFTAQDLGGIDDTFRNGPEFSVGVRHNKVNMIKKFNR